MKRILAIEKCGLFCGGAVNLKSWVEYYALEKKNEIDVLIGEPGDLESELVKTKVNLVGLYLPKRLQVYNKSVLKLKNFFLTLFCFAIYNIRVINLFRKKKYDKIVLNSYRSAVYYLIYVIYVKIFTSSKVVLRLQISETPIRPIFRIVCYLSDSIIVHGTEGYCEREFGASFLKQDKVTCLPNPVNVDKFKFNSSTRESLRKELGLGQNDIVLLSVCYIEPRKGVLELINAFKKVETKTKMVLVHAGGYGSHKDYYENVKSAANENVLLLGKRADIEDIYCIADVFVLFSKYEGMPYVIVEAMASSLPIISTFAGSNAEVVTDDVGILIDFNDLTELESTISNIQYTRDTFESLGKNARRKAVLEYSDRSYFDKLEKII